MEKEDLIEAIRERFAGDIVACDEPLGDLTLLIRREGLLTVMVGLKAAPFSYEMLLDLTCVDFWDREGRFEMVYHLYSLSRNRRLRLKVSLAEEFPSIASLTGLWKNADWLEREVFDMFGVRFDGHPDLRRILLYDEFEGHPLRKSYPWRKEQPRIPMKS
jgi:NADH-quinone oxidoreductase subunit C